MTNYKIYSIIFESLLWHPHRTRNATQSKWNLCAWMGVFTLPASNIKGFAFEFACASCVDEDLTHWQCVTCKNPWDSASQNVKSRVVWHQWRRHIRCMLITYQFSFHMMLLGIFSFHIQIHWKTNKQHWKHKSDTIQATIAHVRKLLLCKKVKGFFGFIRTSGCFCFVRSCGAGTNVVFRSGSVSLAFVWTFVLLGPTAVAWISMC